mmetsp:Transcript_12007/g.30827  ORF Transcript_12007/g.30827 Transcript_12007/m.30827 type:complete len:144 (-) Transcript_12007:272-703(-)|eukprot:jgi/Tetstr1/448778/TSEL_036012.t1
MAAVAAAAANVAKRVKKKNLFDLLRVMPNSGVGAKVARYTYTEKSHWEVTRVKISPDGSHGQVWGTLMFDGKPSTSRRMPKGDTPIPGPLKQVWRVRTSTVPDAGWVSEDWGAVKAALRELEEGAAAGGEGPEDAGDGAPPSP